MTSIQIRLARAQTTAALAEAGLRAAEVLETAVYDPDTRMYVVQVPQDACLAVRDSLHKAQQAMAAADPECRVYTAHFQRAMTALIS